MDATLTLIIGLAAGLLLGGLVGGMLVRARSTTSTMNASPALIEARHAAAVAELRSQEAAARADVQSALAAAEASLSGLREQLGTAQVQYTDLMERTRREAEQRAKNEGDESKVLQALAPVKESLTSM